MTAPKMPKTAALAVSTSLLLMLLLSDRAPRMGFESSASYEECPLRSVSRIRSIFGAVPLTLNMTRSVYVLIVIDRRVRSVSAQRRE